MKQPLLDQLEELVREELTDDTFTKADEVKNQYLQACEQQNQMLLQTFISEGNEANDFTPPKDPLDVRFSEVMQIMVDREKKFRDSKKQETKQRLAAKQNIIAAIEALTNSEDQHIGKAFQEFKELQAKWKELGSVSDKEYKNIQATYHRHVHNFYYNMKLNKDLRDLDFKRNLEQRQSLLQKINSLLSLDNARDAEKLLRLYRMEWSECGPTHAETIDELRNRYRDAIAAVMEKIQLHQQEIAERQLQNLEAKKILVEKMEKIADDNFDTPKAFQAMTEIVQQHLEEWKKTGFASKEENDRIWESFKASMNKFYEKKKIFFAELKKESKSNKDKKIALTAQAEQLANNINEQWDEITKKIISLQKEWKLVGPIEHAEDNKLWKKFREACDVFFEAKRKKFEDRDKEQIDNLKKKEELILAISNYNLTGNVSDDLAALKEFSAAWKAIEFVPIKEKQRIFDAYKKALDAKYDSLKLESSQAHLVRFKNNIEMLSQSEGSQGILKKEKSSLAEKIKKVQHTITQYENNLGFFRNSKNTGSLLSEVENNLQKAKEELKMLQEKMKLFNQNQVSNSTSE